MGLLGGGQQLSLRDLVHLKSGFHEVAQLVFDLAGELVKEELGQLDKDGLDGPEIELRIGQDVIVTDHSVGDKGPPSSRRPHGT